MSNLRYDIHSYTTGEKFGWWGVVWHPVHLHPDDSTKTIKGSGWKASALAFPDVAACKAALDGVALARISLSPQHTKLHSE